MNQVVPVAATFLERLMFETEPIEAISTLCSIWAPRTHAELPQFGLSQAEYTVQICVIYSGEVGNGGHLQYFSNRGGRSVRDTLVALVSIGLSDLASVLSEAIDTFATGTLPDDPREAVVLLEELPEHHIASLDELDRCASGLLPSVESTVLNYVRASRAQILVPETPLKLRIGRSAI